VSRYVPPIVFGKHPMDVVPQRWNFLGQQGWWRVPLGWYARQNVDGTITASPNQDFSNPTYDCQVNIDGYMVFFTLGNPAPVTRVKTTTAFNPLPIQISDSQVVVQAGAVGSENFIDQKTGQTVTVSVSDMQIKVTPK
jgi:hypothetical protein